jgi:hypothetical protein
MFKILKEKTTLLTKNTAPNFYGLNMKHSSKIPFRNYGKTWTFQGKQKLSIDHLQELLREQLKQKVTN